MFATDIGIVKVSWYAFTKFGQKILCLIRFLQHSVCFKVHKNYTRKTSIDEFIINLEQIPHFTLVFCYSLGAGNAKWNIPSLR